MKGFSHNGEWYWEIVYETGEKRYMYNGFLRGLRTKVIFEHQLAELGIHVIDWEQ